MIIGSIFAIVRGSGWSLLALVFGEIINLFAQQTRFGFVPSNSILDSNQTNTLTVSNFESQFTQISLILVLIGIGVLISSDIQVIKTHNNYQ